MSEGLRLLQMEHAHFNVDMLCVCAISLSLLPQSFSICANYLGSINFTCTPNERVEVNESKKKKWKKIEIERMQSIDKHTTKHFSFIQSDHLFIHTYHPRHVINKFN